MSQTERPKAAGLFFVISRHCSAGKGSTGVDQKFRVLPVQDEEEWKYLKKCYHGYCELVLISIKHLSIYLETSLNIYLYIETIYIWDSIYIIYHHKDSSLWSAETVREVQRPGMFGRLALSFIIHLKQKKKKNPGHLSLINMCDKTSLTSVPAKEA